MNLHKKSGPAQGSVLEDSVHSDNVLKGEAVLDKRALRTLFRSKLRLRRQAASDFTSPLCTYLKNQRGIWAGFQALPEEPDLTSVYKQMTHLTWVFPRVDGDELRFHTSENFVTGSFGIQEPTADSRVVDCDQLAGILVPGLGFDILGHRLGRGRGFYDRALTGYKGMKIGVAFSCQVVEDHLPTESHDVLMDALATETELRILRAG